MRNLKKVDPKGVAISKEYGFVTFKQHEDALKALRAINNNPKIFNSNKVIIIILIIVVWLSLFFNIKFCLVLICQNLWN